MNKTELINEIAERSNVDFDTASAMLSAFTDIILDETKKGNKVKIKEFGTFVKQTRKERTGTSPRTKEKILIPEQNTLKFTPSKVIKDDMNVK